MMAASEIAIADTMTYRTIISLDSKIYAQVPSRSVAPGRTFHQQTWVTGYAMNYILTVTDPAGVVTVIDSRWPWGVLDPIYNYDHTFNQAGDYKFKVSVVYCEGGSPLCGHGWIRSILEWTVTVSSTYCSIQTIPYFHQGDSRWGDDEYAYPTPHNQFRTYGCAVTSCVMVLRRFGVNYGANDALTYPGSLNSWLTTEGGYTRGNEVLNWLDVARYSVDRYSSPLPGPANNEPRVTYHTSKAVNIDAGCEYDASAAGSAGTYSRNINSFICSGFPVILRVESLDTGRTHFVVAKAQTAVGDTLTLSILDPARPAPDQRTTLAAYQNRFTGYRLFTAATETGIPIDLVVFMGSPAEMVLTDPSGLITGWNPSGGVVKGIPLSNYLEDGVEDKSAKVLSVSSPAPGTYQLRVVGTGTGPFTMEVDAYGSTNRKSTRFFEGLVTPGREYTYQVEFSPSGTVPGSVTPTTYLFGGFLPPLAPEGGKVFHLGRTVPLKFSVARGDAGPHRDLQARVTLQLVSGGVPVGSPIDPPDSGESDRGGFFRYDSEGDLFIYNLSTKELAEGTWKAIVTLDDGSIQESTFGLKK